MTVDLDTVLSDLHRKRWGPCWEGVGRLLEYFYRGNSCDDRLLFEDVNEELGLPIRLEWWLADGDLQGNFGPVVEALIAHHYRLDEGYDWGEEEQ